MSTPTAASDAGNHDASNEARALAAYGQNSENFRSLNSLMWQIPLIAMTLTGGLWFGVSKVADSWPIQSALLLFAALSNIGLISVLTRLRYIMGEYLNWLEGFYPAGHVRAEGAGWQTRGKLVRTVFQGALGLAATISLLLLGGVVYERFGTDAGSGPTAWYDRYAETVADSYETADPHIVHKPLFELVKGKPPLRVLDVGAGSGRDAAALAELGHRVTAAEPSSKMMAIAKKLHPSPRIEWISDTLPELRVLGSEKFDVVILSAVWMHLPPSERATSLKRLLALTARNGSLYVTLRLGEADPERGIYALDPHDFSRLASEVGFLVEDVGKSRDLLDRPSVSWHKFILRRQ